MNYRQKKETL